MKRKVLASALLLSALAFTSVHAAESSSPYGIVNFSTCVSDSKMGKQEQDAFEALKQQLSMQIEGTEKQLNDIAAKFNDPDYLDGLSPEAEEDLKNKFRMLNEEMNRYQNQYYQTMNQANMRIVQNLSTAIGAASAKVAKEKKLSLVLNKDACFYYADSLDITKTVIAEMDKSFTPDVKKAPTPAPESKAPPAKPEQKK